MSDDFLDDLPSYFTLAKNVSKLSNCRTKVGAVIVSKKPLIACHNKLITHPKYVNGSDYRTSLHAEMRCCMFLSPEQVEGSVIYVYREARTGPYFPAIARPCKYCMEVLRELKVKRIFYTVGDYPYYESERL